MTPKNFVRTSLTLLTLGAVSACGGGSSGASISASNPNFFLGRVSDNVMTGAFNAQGFRADQVQSLVSDTCASGLTGFSTQTRDDGLTGFAASCASWKNGARLVEYERTGGSGVLIEITGSQSGNIVFAKFQTSV